MGILLLTSEEVIVPLLFKEKQGDIRMGLNAGKPVFGFYDQQVIPKPVCLASGTKKKIDILLKASLYMILSNTRIAKALIKLRFRTGCSVPLLFAKPEDRPPGYKTLVHSQTQNKAHVSASNQSLRFISVEGPDIITGQHN